MQQRDTFQTEQNHLKETLQILARESAAAGEHAEIMSHRVQQLQLASGGTYSNDLIVAQNLNARLHIQARSLNLAKDSPYFTRVDFLPDGEELSRWYIGKHGIPDGEGVAVVDWRSPLANLYYGGTMGRTDYEVPDGVVHGELLLKRNFTIENGQLKAMLDADVAGADALLLETLSQMTSDKLREVVSTLQSEQNRIIRYPLTEPLVVQGVAGSGKTTIMLHRIAYLLYTYSKRLSPENLLILAPNPLFLGYISSVLPDLGVDNVLQTTWAQLSCRLLDKRAPRILPEIRPDDLSKAEAAVLERICLFKGSNRMAQLIDRFLDEYEQTLLPEQGFALGPITLLTHEQMRNMFLKDMAPFPFARRLQELIKYLRSRLKDARREAEELLRNAATQRADRIIFSTPDTSERRARLQKLYASAEQRVEELDAAAESLKKNLPKIFAAPSLPEVYSEFLSLPFEKLQGFGLSSEEIETFRLTADRTLPLLKKKSVEHEDLAPILWMARRIFGFENKPRIAHVVIDEAQDMPPLSLLLLQHVFHATYTLVGDMAQGIYGYRGLQSWQQAMECLGARASFLQLQTSYRSTAEITAFSNEVARAMQQPTATSVGRRGAPVKYILCDAAKQIERLSRLIEEIQADSLRTVAVISRTAKQADALAKQLPSLRRLDPAADQLQAGVWSCCAAEVKGLEFDAVLIPDMSQYENDPASLRLLYVAATRPLHRLVCLCVGQWPQHLIGCLSVSEKGD